LIQTFNPTQFNLNAKVKETVMQAAVMADQNGKYVDKVWK